MKIHLNKRSFVDTQDVSMHDIALSYIDTEDVEILPIFNINEEYAVEEKINIFPYQHIDNPNALFFDSRGKVLPDINLKRLGNRYIYEPVTSTEYSPENFICSALIKKSMKYNPLLEYNIKVSVGEDSDNMPISNLLINVFGDAHNRGVCPQNIKVNNGDMSINSLIKGDIASCDFAFLPSSNGIDFAGDLNINRLVSKHKNVWLFVDTLEDLLINVDSGFTSEYKVGYLNDFYKVLNPVSITKRFDKYKTSRHYSKYEHKLLYDQVLLLHKKNEGYIIVTHKEFLENIRVNSQILYDVLMYVYFNSYYESAKKMSFITDYPIDYIAYINTKLSKVHYDINLNDLLKNKDSNIKDDYTLIKINIDNPNVFLLNIDNNKNLYFKKKNKNDPARTNDQIAYLTPKGSIVIYKEEDIFYLKTKLKLSYEIIENGINIIIAPIKNSSKQIHSDSTQKLFVNDYSLKYFICAKKTEAEVETNFTLVPMDNYSYEKHGFSLAKVEFLITEKSVSYDLRIIGGGLPSYEKDDFEMLDISNMYGRPLRLGSILLIKLPEKCREYEEMIHYEVSKHMSSAEYPIYIYYKE